MKFEQNTRRKDIEARANVSMETDPAADAAKSSKGAKGVTIIGGGDHGKVDKGVKRLGGR